MRGVYNRVSKWNGARYEREYNQPLSVALLREEHKEWLEAKEEVDKLDALCDITYVAMGIIWKCDLQDAEIEYSTMLANETVIKLIEVNQLYPAFFIGTYIDVLEYDNEYPVVMNMAIIIQCAVSEMMSMGLSYKQCVEAMNIVCDANDSKSVKKTASDVKANSGDKGPNFVSPEPRLQELLNFRAANFVKEESNDARH